MPALVSFNTHDLERLFITFKRNQGNYSKIKDKVAGPYAESQYRRNRNSSLFFFGALTFIIVVSSTFSWYNSHWNSFIALWMIWGGAFILFSSWSVISYRTNYHVIQQNKTFFNKFERVAEQYDSLEEFKLHW